MNVREGPMSTGAALVVLAVVGTAIMAGGVLFGNGQAAGSHPQAEFEYEFVQQNATLRISHVGGETLTGEDGRLEVRLRNAESGETLDRAWLSGAGHEVGPGDSITIVDAAVGPGDTVRVVWRGSSADGESVAATLAEFELEADPR